MNKTTKRNFNKILKCLYEAREDGTEFLWVRELERRTKIKMGTIVWILYRYLYPDYVEMPDTEALISKGLKIRPIRLKDTAFERLRASGLM